MQSTNYYLRSFAWCALFIAPSIFAQEPTLSLPPDNYVGGLQDHAALQKHASDWRQQALTTPMSAKASYVYAEMNNQAACQPDQQTLSCLVDLLESLAVTLNLANRQSAALGTGNQRSINEVINSALSELDQNLQHSLRSVATSTGLPATSGVVQNFSEAALDSLIHLEQLEDPQTLGYRMPLPEIAWLQPRLTAYATPLPEINPLLKKRLAAEGRAQLLADSEDDLDFGDDYFIALDVSVNGPYFGRKFIDHIPARQNLTKRLNLSRDLQNQRDAVVLLKLDNALDRKALAIAAAALSATEDTVLNRIQTSHLNGFWKFIHNQPQLNLQIKRLKRDDVVGADASSLRLSFSSGLINLTTLKLFSACNTQLDNTGDKCLNAYNYWSESWLLDYGVGVSAYYEQGNIADLSLSLPLLPAGLGGELSNLFAGTSLGFDGNDPNRFVIDGGQYQRYGWAIGATLTNPKAGEKASRSLRADLGADYFRYDRDPVRLNHEALRFTLTWRWGDISLPINLMYRSESEFEANVDDKLAVGLGLSYRTR